MLRLTLVLAVVAACDKGPIQEHRIQYRHSGFGGEDANVEVDLDHRTIVRRDRTHKVAQSTLAEADAKALGDLASCARDEKVDTTQAFDDVTRLVLDGDQRREIAHSLAATTPCTAKLEARLAAFAHAD